MYAKETKYDMGEKVEDNISRKLMKPDFEKYLS